MIRGRGDFVAFDVKDGGGGKSEGGAGQFVVAMVAFANHRFRYVLGLSAAIQNGSFVWADRSTADICLVK